MFAYDNTSLNYLVSSGANVTFDRVGYNTFHVGSSSIYDDWGIGLQ